MKCDPRCLTFAFLIYIHKDDQHYFLSTMLYKVYVNLYDFRVGSYVTLETRVAQSYIYVSHLDAPCQIILHLVFWFRRFFKSFLFLALFWERGHL